MVVRDQARRAITYQFMGMALQPCAPGGAESNLTAAFETTGTYILSVFADGQQVGCCSPPPSRALPLSASPRPRPQ